MSDTKKPTTVEIGHRDLTVRVSARCAFCAVRTDGEIDTNKHPFFDSTWPQKIQLKADWSLVDERIWCGECVLIHKLAERASRGGEVIDTSAPSRCGLCQGNFKGFMEKCCIQFKGRVWCKWLCNACFDAVLRAFLGTTKPKPEKETP